MRRPSFFGDIFSLLGMVALDREEISVPVLIFLFSSRSKRSYHMMPIQAYRTKCVSTLGASAQVDAPFSAV